MIKIENGKIAYNKNVVFDKLQMKIDEGDFVALFGPSGCGKTSILNIISCQKKLDEGLLLLQGEVIGSNSLMRKTRSKIGIIKQDFALLEYLSVIDNILLALNKVTPQGKEKAKEIMQELGISEFAKKRVSDLSGGQMQRVAIARALIRDPKLIVADEPTGSLDTKNSLIIFEILKKLNEKGITIVIATHDPVAVNYAKKVIEYT